MAVGKKSMERASKVAGPIETKKTEVVKKAPVKKAPARKNTVKSAEVVAAPKKEVIDAIVYQTSSQVLERDAEPNEAFGIGDAIPVYFL